ncbi:hypothetical protein [Nocardioides sp.]|uniref:hypothetical protein n=1 Tax=Nocardioides sp. TaxID=35761 RepID=UPI0037835076
MSSTPTRTALRWLASFTGFPLGGLAAMVLVGPVDSVATAAAGGLVTGAVLGTVQGWAMRADRRTAAAWSATTALGLAVGLALGSSLVGFDTTMAALAVQGIVSGAFVGAAQAGLLHRRLGRLAIAWPAYLAGAWALGWTITTAIGVEVDEQFTVFGSAGAVTVAALTTVLPTLLVRRDAS